MAPSFYHTDGGNAGEAAAGLGVFVQALGHAQEMEPAVVGGVAEWK